jgi:transketolase
MTIFSPCDPIEVDEVTKAAYSINGPCYIRLGKGGEKNIHKKQINFEIGKAYKILNGDRIAIFCTGSIIEEAIKAAEILKNKNINVAIYSFPTIKPIDKKTIIKCAKEMELIITLEEHNIVGGLGGAVAEVMAENNGNAILKRMGLKDEYTSVVGNQSYLRNHYKIDSDEIVKVILNYTKGKK